MISGVHKLYYTPFTTNISGTIAATADYLGMTGPEGIRLTREDHTDPIYNDANGPDAPQDVVFRGVSMYLDFVLQEIDRTQTYQMLYPWGIDPDDTTPPIAQIPGRPDRYGAPGRFGCQVAGKLEAIPMQGSAAESQTEPTEDSASTNRGRQMFGIVDTPGS